jgi:hypothetical protein
MLLTVSSVAHADSMSSTNYSIQADVISIGGNESSSTNYSTQDTIGESLSGENLVSANFAACVGFQCFQVAPYISFSVSTGTTYPGSLGGTVNLGILTSTSVVTSDGSSVSSVFIDAETNASYGAVISVSDSNSGLASASVPADIIDSQTASLTAGTPGFGVCVFSVSEDAGSPTALVKASPFNGACDKSSSHSVGGVTTSGQTIVSSSGALISGQAEILLKAASGGTVPAHDDYTDEVTFIISASY